VSTEARVPHGFALDLADHRLLRGRPPALALAWVADRVGPGARVVGVRARSGGTSSAVHVVHMEDRVGRRSRLVLRRFVRADWLAEEPDVAVREAEALRVLAGTDHGLPLPELVAVDETGAEAGAPAVLITALPGRVDWAPRELGPWLDRLVALLPPIHAVRVPGEVELRPYRPYELGRELAPPRWTRYPRAWARAIAAYEGPAPSAERVFVHRDFHPGNVLWRRGRVSGLVDWANASVGAPEADVGHCRANLAGHSGLAVADDFLARWQAVTGRTGYHPYWDLAVEVSTLDSYGQEEDPALDAFVARAVARLG
jgi:aminoglycoside phosphotransferase (APT) family kinase protein